jgi:hypothetical protein
LAKTLIVQAKVGDSMVKCPICQAELKNKTDEGWLCECGELIPLNYSDEARPQCGCGHQFKQH